MIVVVSQHGGAVQILAGGSDAQHPRVAMSDRLAQTILSGAGAEAPHVGSVTQLGLAFVNVELNRCRCSAVEDDSLITRRLEISSPVAARGSASEGSTGERA